MSLDERFLKASEEVKELSFKPSTTCLLELYSLYKQATVGDCNTGKPNILEFEKKAKWEAWNKQKGLSQDEAKEKYIIKANDLIKQSEKNE
ncbi:putative acyl-CoA-binding protein [Vespa mandarinia]|uniref:putative acyl-CoA-binding protein n=1 Tax=Vespa mandarinia TaxID=7446 RepID=UPI0016152D73|nr:putative acyl-CoA-binding protein [Vespa mandarinia]XP_046819320.1 putative acyl-CoA-binding protein [Vespa crabro]